MEREKGTVLKDDREVLGTLQEAEDKSTFARGAALPAHNMKEEAERACAHPGRVSACSHFSVRSWIRVQNFLQSTSSPRGC